MSIANLNAEAKRMNALINKEEAQERARQAKRVVTLARRQGAAQSHREKIGTMVRRAYLKNNQIAKLVTQHGKLTPMNARSASLAFGSPAFARAAKNQQNQLKTKVLKYRNMWTAWYKGLTPQQRVTITRNVYKAATGNNAGENLLYHTSIPNPLFFARLALTKRPNAPTYPNMSRMSAENARRVYVPYERAEKTHSFRWMGAAHELSILAQPKVNAVLRRHGLPFSMTNARRNLIKTQGNVVPRGSGRPGYKTPVGMSYASAAGALPNRPLKGLKGYAGGRTRRNYRQALRRALS
jgi:hypothetical protein